MLTYQQIRLSILLQWLVILLVINCSSTTSNTSLDSEFTTRTTKPPQLNPSFKATFEGTAVATNALTVLNGTYDHSWVGPLVYNVSGLMLYDAQSLRSTIVFHLEATNRNNESMSLTERWIHVDGLFYIEITGVCSRPPFYAGFPLPWSNFYLNRKIVQRDRLIGVYRNIFQKTSLLTIDLTTQLPLRFAQGSFLPSGPYQGASHNLSYSLFGSSMYDVTFKAQPISNWAPFELFFEPPAVCLNNTGGLFCPSPGSVMNLTMVRTHSKDEYSLANHNTADMRGDVQYLCGRRLTAADPSLVSMWNVAVNTSFSQYTFCNFNVCAGWESARVGKRINYAVRQLGQCEPPGQYPLYGTWYSLPAAGQCSESQQVGGDTCYWKALQRIKTISLACAVQSTIIAESCLIERVYDRTWGSFNVTTHQLELAFEICPDIPPTPPPPSI